MLANRLAFAALAVACIGAAAGGGYLASRQSSAPVSAAVSAPGSATSSTAKPVQETEAIVGDTAEHRLPLTAPVSRSRVTPAGAWKSRRARLLSQPLARRRRAAPV